ncbi:MAG: hypothetical protein ACHRHE_21470 [Tepidisphaerales bacterium]
MHTRDLANHIACKPAGAMVVAASRPCTSSSLRVCLRAFASLRLMVSVAALLVTMLAGRAAKAFPPLLFAAEGAKTIIRYDETGQVAWEYPAEMSRDVWLLPNGNMLFCYNDNYDSSKNDNPSGVMEVSPNKQVVFHFKTTGQVWSCQRMADGNTLVGAASQGKLLIVSPKAEVVREIKLINRGGHSCIRNARQIKGGDFLVAEESARAVRRYSPEGKLVREIKLSFAPYSAVLLENGNILACGQQTMVEVDEADKIVWSLEGKELPDLGVRWFAGIQVLPGGNICICNAGGKIGFFEITREKKIAWQSKEGFPMGHGIQRLDVKGEAVK